jgi:hypothetical protein
MATRVQILQMQVLAPKNNFWQVNAKLADICQMSFLRKMWLAKFARVMSESGKCLTSGYCFIITRCLEAGWYFQLHHTHIFTKEMYYSSINKNCNSSKWYFKIKIFNPYWILIKLTVFNSFSFQLNKFFNIEPT